MPASTCHRSVYRVLDPVTNPDIAASRTPRGSGLHIFLSKRRALASFETVAPLKNRGLDLQRSVQARQKSGPRIITAK